MKNFAAVKIYRLYKYAAYMYFKTAYSSHIDLKLVIFVFRLEWDKRD